jgi:putative membrane-bound dehydrogenase-like protein
MLTFWPFSDYNHGMNPFAFRTAVAIALFTPLAHAAQFRFASQTLTVPDGFEVELVAAPNLVERPVSASFDDRGRLYVTDSSGSNEKPDKQLANPSHRVLRLEDTDGDGRFDKSVVFADKVMFPQGCLWYAGSVYVAGPPSIWKFTDTDGDGIADKREEWFKGGTLTGCANDIHGPYLGPDGYIYWTKGAFDEQTHILGNGRKVNDRAAHIYRARPDGSDLDLIMSGGMDNPVEVAFTPEGETIFTSTFIDFSQPGYRDGIAHAVYGAVFGKQHDALEDGRVKRASPDLMHPFFQAGNAAECGLCRYESGVFGAGFRDNLFATTFNLHKVTRHVLLPSGATYASTDSDFLVSDSVDFHATDVLEDADGSLLVVDTGGWYKLCCPSSQLAKPDVLGAIYRVHKQGTARLAAAMREAAYARLVKPPSLNKEDPITTLTLAGRNPTPQNRTTFVEALSRYRQTQDDRNAQTARAAAEGLGRLRDKDSAPAILETIGYCGKDRILEQSLTRALIDIEAPTATRAGLKSPKPAIQRASLIALDQMDHSDLKASDILPFLSSSEDRLRSAANWVVGHHPDWGGALAGFFRERLSTQNLSEPDREVLNRQLAQLSRNPAIQELVGEVAGNPAGSKQIRLVALRAMAQTALKETPAPWTNALPRTLAEADDTIVQAAIAAVRALPAAKTNAFDFSPQLLRVGRDLSRATDVRLDALSAMREGLNAIEPDLFDFLRSNLDSARPPTTRTTAAAVVGRAKLNDDQLLALANGLKTVGPLEISRLISAFSHSGTEAVGLRLVAALNESKGFSGLRADNLKPILEQYSSTVQEHGKALLVRLNVDLEKQKAHLDEMLASLPAGDLRRGQAVFNSSKTACLTCHAIGYVGGHVGPDLTNIGQARTERDLLESVIYPSASFVRSYEPMIVVTKSGDEYSGVIRRDAPEEVLLATGVNTEMRIARSEIGEMRPGTVSIMPAGLDEQLNRQELADLVTFLKAAKR